MWTQEELDQYKWFHYMELTNGTYTRGWKENKHLFDWILSSLNRFNFKNNKVIDVGCRDGLLSFKMEDMGANEVVAVDNDISRGAVELLIPRLRSKINMYECNLYDLRYKNYFDYSFCYGVLYHLRYPFLGLKKLVDITKVGGRIVLETGIVVNENLEGYGLCGATAKTNSPYEGSSCIFFNRAGLIDTMSTFECKVEWCERYNKVITKSNSPYEIDRCIFSFIKEKEYVDDYWDGIHNYHTNVGFSF